VLPHVRNVLTGLPQLLRFAADWLFKMRLAQRKIPYTLISNSDGSFPVEFNSEQSPSESNQVLLMQEEDRHGMKRVQVNWRLQRGDAESAQRGFVLLRNSINSGSRCRLEFDDEQLLDQLRAAPPVGGHHMGTARMGSTPRSGVVDANCTVFGLPNLYVASSAVFPTSGYANPTLTIVALAVRLARHIKRELAGHAPAPQGTGVA
jgi:choline dehydrogenase-like flavoprotein